MFDLREMKKKNICIMGLMGAGKSIIGKDLSKYLNFAFYDSDKEIELKTKKNINLIFREKGEAYFRKIEESVCLELLNIENCVISLGGGSIINKSIRNAINQNSYSIYLQVKLNNLLDRLKSSKKRPLLNQNNNKKKETLKKLYIERKSFYEKSDLIVNNDNEKFEVLEKIKSELKLYAK